MKWIWVEVCFVHSSKSCMQSRGITVLIHKGGAWWREGATSAEWVGGWMCVRVSSDVLETRDAWCLCLESKLAKSSTALYWMHWQYILFTWIAYNIIYRLIVCRLARRGRPWAQVYWTAPSVGWIVFQNLSLQAWMCSRNQSDKHYSCPAWWDA